MARFFVPLDVNYQFDDKLSAVSVPAECLYVRSLAYAKRAATEGRLRTGHLATLAIKMTKPQRYADELVEHGLWEAVDGGWQIVGWLKHNPSNEQIAIDKENRKRKGQESAHRKYHVKPGAYEPDCEFCNPPKPEGEPIGRPTPDPKVGHSNRREHEQEREHDNEHEHEPSSSRPGLTLVTNPPHDDDRITEAIELHARHEMTSRGKGTGYARSIRERDPDEHGPALRAHLERWPDATPDELAFHVLGVPSPTTLPDRRPPQPEYPPCDDCASSGWITVWPDNGGPSTTVERCHCPRGQANTRTA